MTTFILYGLALGLLLLSFLKDRGKTRKALIRAWKSFENVMPQFLGIVLIVGIMLSVLKPEVISKMIGNGSGAAGVILSSVVGSITIMPTFVAFQTAQMMLDKGAGYPQIAALVSTLTMVGIVTFPLEARYIGRKAAFYRNLAAFLFSFIVALVVGGVMKEQ